MLTASRAIPGIVPALAATLLAAAPLFASDGNSGPRLASGTGAPGRTAETGIVELLVVDAGSGVGVPWATVRLPDGTVRTAEEGGRCRLEGLLAGRIAVDVEQLAYRPAHGVALDVAAGQARRVVVRLEPLAHAMPRVEVRARRGESPREATEARTSIAADRAAALPNPTDDPFKLIQLLPGASGADVGSEFHLRGGGSDETLVRIDGMEVRSLFHGRDLGGVTGILPLGIVERLDVYSGAFPAELGGRLSNAIAVDLRDRGPQGWHGRVAADVTSARGILERHGAESSLFVSAREGYLHRILDAIQHEAVVEPAYRDLLVRAVRRPDASRLLSANYLRVEDHVLYEDGVDSHFVNADYTDHYGWGALRWLPSARTVVRGQVDGAFSAKRRSVAVDGRDDQDSWRAGMRLEGSLAQGPHLWKAGVETEREWGTYAFRGRNVVRIDAQGRAEQIDSLDVAGNVAARRAAGWLSDEWTPWRSLALSLGLRESRDTGTDAWRTSPRLAAALTLPGEWLVRAAWGRHHQPPLVGLTGESELLVSSERAQSAVHTVFGAEKTVGVLRLGVDVWRKRFQPLDGVVSRTVDGVVETHVIRDGLSRGCEASVRGDGRNSSWWLAYSLDRSEWSDGEHVYARDFDALHTLSLANTYHVGRDWDLGVSYRFRTGTPYTVQSWRRVGGSNWILEEGVPNGARLPDYHRVDLRVTRRFQFDGWEMSVWGEALNLTNHDNVLWYAWRLHTADGSGADNPERLTRTGLPGIPSVGLEARF